jgi:hypothetical protein
MHPAIIRNTLLSPRYTEKIFDLPREDTAYTALREVLARFRHMKNSASEMQTEIHLVKPMLKILGYSIESKPKFFEDHVKGPDFALFCSEEERLASSSRWGTKEFYRNVAAVLSVKRYGRNLGEGISGFYLDFESRIPVYQIIYLARKADVPWGILTNGRNWILFRKPKTFEKRLIELDLDGVNGPAGEPDDEILHFFYHLFSCSGLVQSLPALIDEERAGLIDFLKDAKMSVARVLQDTSKKVEVYPRLLPLCDQLFPGRDLPLTEAFLKERNVPHEHQYAPNSGTVNSYDGSALFTYLFTGKELPVSLNVEEIILEGLRDTFTKESLFSLRILDMTPGFGTVMSLLADGLTYLSFTLPYRERNTFVAEWENELALNRYIFDHVLYGVEKSHIALDIFRNNVTSRYNGGALHYRLGDVLLGMSLADLAGLSDDKSQTDLFSRPPDATIQEFRKMYRTYFSLSERIKEDIEMKRELQLKLDRYTERLRDILDLLTAAYFTKKSDEKKIKELLYALDSDESRWQSMRGQSWFVSSKELAQKHGFFHMELEFPLLLNDKFDLIVVQPWLTYAWEEKMPLVEVSKAYVKRATAYLKPNGRIALISDDGTSNVAEELVKSKKYQVSVRESWIVLKKL